MQVEWGTADVEANHLSPKSVLDPLGPNLASLERLDRSFD